MRFSVIRKPILFILFAVGMLFATHIAVAQSTIPDREGALTLRSCLADQKTLAEQIVVEWVDGEYLQAVCTLKDEKSRHAIVDGFTMPTDFLQDHWEETMIELDDVQLLCMSEFEELTAENIYVQTRINPLTFAIHMRGIIAQHGICYLFFANPELEEEDISLILDKEFDESTISPGGIID